MEYKEKYNLWLQSNVIDDDMKNALREIKDEAEIEDRFYKDLDFGTGGLRGVIGEGTNRVNIYTIGKATKGLATYAKRNYKEPSVVIAYDSRNMSKEFARYAADTLTSNGVKAYLFEELTPTPILSFAVRFLKCSYGIVITASHNPSEYNGYKVYNENGGQVTDTAAKEIIKCVNESLIEAIEPNNSLLNFVSEDVYVPYMKMVKELSIRKDLVKVKAKELNIIYTPIHGSGNKPVRRVLSELGYSNLKVVKEQEHPNGDFPTVRVPNPEYSDVFSLAIQMAKKDEAYDETDIIIGTDPDCDRMGVMVKDSRGEFQILTGNQIGVLLSHYILSSLNDINKLSPKGVLIKTIVTTEMIKPIAKAYDVDVFEVLTGFKYIGELIHKFEIAKGKCGNNEKYNKDFIFGFEESYGYLSGDFVRDKDAVIASSLICEMALYYKITGKTLYDGLIELYDTYGYYAEELVSKELKGIEGMHKINEIMDNIRNRYIKFNKYKLIQKLDYKKGINDLPKSNVVKFVFENDEYFVIRPSGTEPKIKLYFGVKGNSIKDAKERLAILEKEVLEKLSL